MSVVRLKPLSRFALALALLGWVSLGMGAAPIDAVRVRVPVERVAEWFPRGSEIRSLSPDEFNTLIRDANDGLERSRSIERSVLARADHAVSWEDGVLVGRSTFTVRRDVKGPTWLPLGEWSPAVTLVEATNASKRPVFRTDGKGGIGLWLDESTPSPIRVNWKLRARANSRGRAFGLTLPLVSVGRLDLDLPANLTPDLKSTITVGTALGRAADRKSWTFLGPGGVYDLRLREESTRAARPEVRPWVYGNTSIDVDQNGATWTGEWSVDLVEGGTRSLEIEFDPELELLDIKGQRVSSFQARRAGGSIRATVLLAPSPQTHADLTILCASKVPASGVWPVPAARPIEAVWIGGRTTVRLDPSRNVTECKIKTGSRVAPDTPLPANRPTVIAIEPTEPISVADLTLRPSTHETLASVVGMIQLDGESPRLLAQVRWSLRPGTVPTFVAELSAGWSVTRVESEAEDETIPWRAETLPGGRTRLHLLPPPIDEMAQSIGFQIQAAAPPADLTTPFDLPRLRPVGTLLEDELWIAVTRRTEVLRPTFARSLAWVSTDEILNASQRIASMRVQGQHAAAWRWIGDDAEARARVVPLPSAEIARIVERATVHSARLDLDWRVEVDRSSVGEVLPVQLSSLAQGEIVWTLADEPNTRLISEPIPNTERVTNGLPTGGLAWRIQLPRGLSDRLILRGRLSTGWSGDGSLPLLSLSSRTRSAGTVEVRVANQLLADYEASNLRVLPLESSGDDSLAIRDATQAESRSLRAFAYDGKAGELHLKTWDGTAGQPSGMIREAVLTSIIEPGGRRRHRLLLQVATLSEGSFELTFPRGLAIDRVTRGGQLVEVNLEGGKLALPLGPLGGSRSFSIDYTGSERPGSLPICFPDLPTCSLPCASFCWEISTPPGWRAESPTRGLRAADPAVVRLNPSLQGRTTRSNEGVPAQLRLDASLEHDASKTEMTLADWLLALEGDKRPLVIDRLALIETGWGPRSRIRPGQVAETLKNLGLTLFPSPDTLLLTTLRALPADLRSSIDSIRARSDEAVRRSSDRDDRYQSLERWRGESTPRGYRSAALETWPWPDRDISGWATQRFVAGSFPARDAGVYLREIRAELGWQWATGCLAFALTILALNWFGRPGILAFASLAALVLAVSFCHSPRWAVLGETGLAGILLGLAFVLPRLARNRVGRIQREHVSHSRPSARSTSRTAGVSVGIMLLLVGSTGSLAREDEATRILALLPYEGIPQADTPPSRVLIRLEDDQKLRRLAAIPTSGSNSFVTITEVVHRVSRPQPEFAVVESIYGIVVEGTEKSPWRFPIGNSVDLVVSVDGRETGVALALNQPDALIGQLEPGSHQVKISRRVPLSREEGRASLLIPIVATPTARIQVAAEERRQWLDVLTGTGVLASMSRGIEGELGPADRISLTWRDDPKLANAPRGQVDALVLWDAVPAGDLARVRLTLKDPEGTSSIRLAVESGTFVRPENIPGLVDVAIEGTPDRPEWVARLDPPLPSGTVAELQIWRPITASRTLPTTGDPPRTLPRLTTLGTASFKGVVALRHPPEWSGRLGARGDRDAVGEEVFAELWGAFPNDTLTLSGASRFGVGSLVAVSTGPSAPRLQVHSKLNLRLGEGRIDTRLDTQLKSASDTVTEADVALPESFIVLRVEAEGLTAVDRTTASRLRLRFDGIPSRVRNVRINGRFNTPGKVPLSEASRYALATAPFRWTGTVIDPIELTVESQVRPEVTATGLKPLMPANDASKILPASTPFRSGFVLEPSTDLLQLRWPAAPPRVRVDVDSRLTLMRDGAEWLALIRYDIEGGPLDSFFIKVPSEWADDLAIDAPGQPMTVTKEPRPNANVIVTLKPASPVWGSAMIELRGKRKIDAQTTVDFPDAAPLGQGAVDKRLSIIRTKAKRLPLEASASLMLDDQAGPANPPSRPGGNPDRNVTSYRVRSEPWSLRVKFEPGDDSADSPDIARVLQSSILVSRHSDGSTWGQGRFDVEPTTGRYLAFDFAERADVPWAVVDGQPVLPLRNRSGTWLVPIDRPTLGRVIVAWRTGPETSAEGAIKRIPMPRIQRTSSATLVSFITPESGKPRPVNASLEAIDESTWWIEAVERRSKRLAALASDLPPTEPRDRDAIVEGLDDWSLLQQQARRSIRSDGGKRGREQVGRLEEAGMTLFETLELLGLSDLAKRAMSRNGDKDDSRAGSTVRAGLLDPLEPIRIRQIGVPWRYRATERAESGLPLVLWEDEPQSPLWLGSKFWISIATWFLLVGSAVLVNRGWIPTLTRSLVLLTAIGLVTLSIVQPAGAFAAFLLILAGRSK